MLLAIKVKGLSLAQEARIIRRLEKSRRQSAKWAREKQKAIELAKTGFFPHFEAKPIPAVFEAQHGGKIKADTAKYLARLGAQNRLSDIARKIGADADMTPYRLGEMVAMDEAQKLYIHRIQVVRPEARAVHLALGFLRGVPYNTMENKSYDWPNWDRVEEIATKYGQTDSRVLAQRFAQWKQEGEKRGLIGEPGTVASKPSFPGGPGDKAEEPKDGFLSTVKEFFGIAS